MAIFGGYFGGFRGASGHLFDRIHVGARQGRAGAEASEIAAPALGSPTLGSIDDHMITAMRIILAAAALLVVYFDPADYALNRELTCAALTLYLIYSAALYVLARCRHSLLPSKMTHWIDLGWYVALVGLNNSSNSIFFLFFFFAILTASFQWGFTSGWRVSLTSTAFFIGIVVTTTLTSPYFNVNLFLLRAAALLVLGYMMSFWGGSENHLKRQLVLLKDVSALSNPRFGVDHTLCSLLERLRSFYDADACLLVISAPSMGGYNLYRARRWQPKAAGRAERLTDEAAALLLAPPPAHAMVCNRASPLRAWWGAEPDIQVWDVMTAARLVETPKIDEPGVSAWEAASCMTVPVRYRGETRGRLYLSAKRRCTFAAPDVAFLLQVLEHTMPAIDNIRLVDRLASDAAETERQRIARDLHDSVIQPYIGLQLGLAAIRQKLNSGDVNLHDDIERVMRLTGSGIAELRRYIGGLRDGAESESGLVAAVQRFARKFTEATSIVVRVEAATTIPISDRLAAEVFQMAAEGLSNIRRHTRSAWATVHLACHSDRLMLRIENDCPAGTASIAFTPRSITERAAALGGDARVERSDAQAMVIVEIPL